MPSIFLDDGENNAQLRSGGCRNRISLVLFSGLLPIVLAAIACSSNKHSQEEEVKDGSQTAGDSAGSNQTHESNDTDGKIAANIDGGDYDSDQPVPPSKDENAKDGGKDQPRAKKTNKDEEDDSDDSGVETPAVSDVNDDVKMDAQVDAECDTGDCVQPDVGPDEGSAGSEKLDGYIADVINDVNVDAQVDADCSLGDCGQPDVGPDVAIVDGEVHDSSNPLDLVCEPDESINYLATVQDRFHKTFDVYTDAHAAGNHFAARGKMWGDTSSDEDAVGTMDENYAIGCHSGVTCIEASFTSRGLNWGGWYFLNGLLEGDETSPKINWGDTPNAGVDLTGATSLTFWVKGKHGGEKVEFFAFGVGRDASTGEPKPGFPYPDSESKLSIGFIELSAEWKEVTFDLKGLDLSYVLGGFGWVTNAPLNDNADVVFYLDDIQYNKSSLEDPRFLVSFESTSASDIFDVVLRNVAFTYDNAVALLAFIAAGELDRARLIADAFIYAQNHDRFYEDGRLRNAYQAGDLILAPGWTPHGKVGTVRMPGWYTETEGWSEDEFQVSTHTGNLAWAMLALLAMYEVDYDSKYLEAVVRLGEWIESNTRDERGNGGYTGGVQGWEPKQTKLTYKSTEHNIDLFSAFTRLYCTTGEEQWLNRAEYAKVFVESMWDEIDGKFWTGTGLDGVTTNKDVIPLDTQTWTLLSFPEWQGDVNYLRAIEYAETFHRVESGFDFNTDRDGIWYEGTAQMGTVYAEIGLRDGWEEIQSLMDGARIPPDGGIPAANKDGLTTGFDLSDDTPWLYYNRGHIGATGWAVFSECGANPFWLNSTCE